MKAMVLNQITQMENNASPLDLLDVPVPEPSPEQVLIRVNVCGVCHTELDEIEGRTPPAELPIIPGHQLVGTIERDANGFRRGERVGVAWIFSTCGNCSQCRSGNENLCALFRATGRDANGGYAEYAVVPARFVHRIPEEFSDVEAAPLLCAGAIGYRSIRLTGLQDGQTLGLTGFGASAHLVLKMTRSLFPNTKVFVFARSKAEQKFAMELGAVWAGDSEERSPQLLDRIIDTTPAWKPVLHSLRNLQPGGRLVVNAIRKEHADQSSLNDLNYAEHLWMEKEIKTVANVTRKDVQEFLQLAAQIPIKPQTEEYPLVDANRALLDLKQRKIRGGKVLRIR